MENPNEPNNAPDNNNAMGEAAPTNEVPASPFWQKNIVMGAALFLILAVLVGAFFLLTADKALDIAQFEKDEAVLNEIGADIDVLSQDDTLFDEIDQTFGDILDEVAGIPSEEALDTSSIDAEASQVDLSDTLDAFDADNALLQELDQTFDDVSQ